MGRILDTFRNGGPARILPTPSDPLPAPSDAEVPFIEIGPRRHILASPSVLAVKADVAPPPPTPNLPRPHSVSFRSVPAPQRPAAKAPFAPELVAYHAPHQPASAEYADLLATLLEATRSRIGAEGKVLLFSAVRAGAGSTTALLNLAITAAREGRRVAVVDANLRRPAVAERLGVVVQPGLTEVLHGECALADAVHPTAQENLSVLSSGAPAPVWADGESLRGVLSELSAEFDLVLIDGPVWDGRSAGVLAAAAEALFLVVPGGEADSPPTSELVRSLPSKGAALAGCVLTTL